MEEYRIRHGIKLYKRKCDFCKMVDFWVPKSSPQKYCSDECFSFKEEHGERKTKAWLVKHKKLKKALLTYKIKDEDYAEFT